MGPFSLSTVTVYADHRPPPLNVVTDSRKVPGFDDMAAQSILCHLHGESAKLNTKISGAINTALRFCLKKTAIYHLRLPSTRRMQLLPIAKLFQSGVVHPSLLVIKDRVDEMGVSFLVCPLPRFFRFMCVPVLWP